MGDSSIIMLLAVIAVTLVWIACQQRAVIYRIERRGSRRLEDIRRLACNANCVWRTEVPEAPEWADIWMRDKHECWWVNVIESRFEAGAPDLSKTTKGVKRLFILDDRSR